MNTVSLKAQRAMSAPVYEPIRILHPVSYTRPVKLKTKYLATDLTRVIARNAILVFTGFTAISLILTCLMDASIYRISSLKSEINETTIRSQMLEEQMLNKSSLAFVEAKAKSMGMVKNYDFKWISLKEVANEK